MVMAALTAGYVRADPVRRRPRQAPEPRLHAGDIRRRRQPAPSRPAATPWSRRRSHRSASSTLPGEEWTARSDDRRGDPAGPTGPRRRPGWPYPHRGIRTGSAVPCPARRLARDRQTRSSRAAIVGRRPDPRRRRRRPVGQPATRRERGRLRGRRRHGGPVGTTGVAETALAPSGVVYLLGRAVDARDRAAGRRSRSETRSASSATTG